MPNGALRRAVTAHLGLDTAGHGLTSLQDYRNAMVTAHSVNTSEWLWSARPGESPVTAVVLASKGAMVVGRRRPERSSGLLLHSTHSLPIRWTPDSTATVIWLETDSLVGSGAPLAGTPITLRPTALARGLQAFAESLTGKAEAHSAVSEHVIERLLIEMVHGTLLEHREGDAAQRQAVRPMHRARMLMLLNRTDPDYGSRELARDLHVSTRQLQRLFARERTSPAAELRNLRAELALSLLQDPQYRHLTTSQVADHAGFTNAAAMRRGLHAIDAPTPQAARTP